MLRRLSSTVGHMSTRAALPSTMQACAIQSQGSLDVIALSEVPVPQPAADELVYRVAWAGFVHLPHAGKLDVLLADLPPSQSQLYRHLYRHPDLV